MDFRYKEHHVTLVADCPPKTYQPIDMFTYRWVFKADNEINFQSQYEKDMKRKKIPKRYNDMSDLEKCERMSLSLFVTFESAENQFFFLKDIQNFNERAYLYFGKGIAEGKIELTDGVNEVPENEHGHFNHHPVQGLDYHKKFNIVSSFL